MYDEVGAGSLEGEQDVGDGAVFDSLSADGVDGAGDRDLLLRGIAYDDDFVEVLVVGLEADQEVVFA
ncbi:hypothetical protein ACQ86N_18620 [Puia sp. P3]|uniref:hypothetical protein n=1 Tax=Puia sp. P3 TaxID=3423952 RepID=UPI003D669C91